MPAFNKILVKDVLLHFAFWALYVVSEMLANYYHLNSAARWWQMFRSVIISLPVLMIPTYFMIWVAVPRFLKKGKIVPFVLSIIGICLIVFYGRIRWLELINYLENGRYFKMPPSKIVKNVIRDYSIVALAICIYIINDYRRKQKLNEELVKAKAEAEIQLLKGQLQPHFLFNSLNNIYSLALMKSELTADSILKLTELLDYLVYKANQEKVALAKEIQLLNNYIDLEQLRYGEKLKVEQDIQVLQESVLVAPLILLPFAENCFKHGGAGKNGIFLIQIDLIVDLQKLVFKIRNSKKASPNKKKVNGGVGLKNIRKRLNLLYPDKHFLKIEDEAGFYEVFLEIKLNADL